MKSPTTLLVSISFMAYRRTKLVVKDKKYLGREGNPRPIVVSRQKGPYVWDEKGKRYIDFFMGWCVGNVGWNVKEIVSRMKKYHGPTYVSPMYLYKGWAELAELLAKITPGKLTKSFRATGGTEAIEIALQAAMTHTKRHKFISIEGSYHGHSVAAMSIGSSDFRHWYKNLLNHCNKIEPPLDKKAAKKVVALLRKRDIAAFIAEPIVCNLAVEIPTKEFFAIVSAACKKYGTVFIADEVATGFGRTGKMFACEHYDLKPDIMTVAKGATGGFGALGATIMTPDVAKSFEFSFSFYSTFGWHPLNVEATAQNIRYLLRHKTVFLKNAHELSIYFTERLHAMRLPYSAQVRIKGLAIGIVFNKKGYVGKLISRCLENGLLIADATLYSIVMYPPLNLDKKVAKRGLDIFEKCL